MHRRYQSPPSFRQMEPHSATTSRIPNSDVPVEQKPPSPPGANEYYEEVHSALEQHLVAMLNLVRVEYMPISDILDLDCLSFFLDSMLKYPDDKLVQSSLLILSHLSRHLEKAFQATPGGAEWKTEVCRYFSIRNLSKLTTLIKSENAVTVRAAAQVLRNLASASEFLKNQIKRSKIEESFLHLVHSPPPGLEVTYIKGLMSCLYNCNVATASRLNEVTLKMFAVNHGGTDSALLKTLLPTLRRTLEEARPAEIPMACELLYRFLREGGLDRPVEIVNAGLCLPLCNLLDHSDAGVVDCAANFVVDVVRGDDALLNQTLVDSGVLSRMKRFLHDSREPFVVNALFAARVLTTGRKTLSEMVLCTWLDDVTLNRLIHHESQRVRLSLALLLDNEDFLAGELCGSALFLA